MPALQRCETAHGERRSEYPSLAVVGLWVQGWLGLVWGVGGIPRVGCGRVRRRPEAGVAQASHQGALDLAAGHTGAGIAAVRRGERFAFGVDFLIVAQAIRLHGVTGVVTLVSPQVT